MEKIVFAVLSAIVIVCMICAFGCESKPLQSSHTDNPTFEVDKLFTHDGITVYRFYDGGARYFTRSETFWNESCGKNCTRHMNIPTEE